MPPETLFAQWREANQKATDAERTLFEASLQALRGHGVSPSEKDYEHCKELRQEARRLFDAALADVDAAGRAAGWGERPSNVGNGASQQ